MDKIFSLVDKTTKNIEIYYAREVNSHKRGELNHHDTYWLLKGCVYYNFTCVNQT